MGPAIVWYWYDHQVFVEIAGNAGIPTIWDIGSDKWGNLEILTGLDFYRHLFATRLGEKIFAFTGVPFLVLGLLLKAEKTQEYVFHAWLLGILVYFFVVARGNYAHEYYQVPVIPVGAVFIGRGLHAYFRAERFAKYRVKWLTTIVILSVLFVPVYSGVKLQARLKVREKYLRVAERVKRVSAPQDRILVLGRGKPEVIYYSERRGWHTRQLDRALVEQYVEKGTRFLVVSDVDLLPIDLEYWLRTHYRLLHEGTEGLIFQLA